MAASAITTSVPTAGGTLTINGVSLGSYDYHIVNSLSINSAFISSQLFTATEDTRSAIVVVRGDFTISTGFTVQPAIRKRFLFVYVGGTLWVDGIMSMTQRGANHTGFAGGDIRIANGTFFRAQGGTGTITNPTISAVGGSGGAAVGTANTVGVAGASAASNLIQTGGGGSGGVGLNNWSPARFSGAGGSGSCFSGGAGGGGFADQFNNSSGSATAGSSSGGSGGLPQPTHVPSPLVAGAAGGTGNPYVQNGNTNTANPSGTGGVLVVYAVTRIRGSGFLSASGVSQTQTTSAVANTGICGGGSGAGLAFAIGGTVDWVPFAAYPDIRANGGTAIASGPSATNPTRIPVNGGSGGNGTAAFFTP